MPNIPKPQLKKQFDIPKGGLSADNVKLKRVKKYTKKSRTKHKQELSKILAQDPAVNATHLAKRMKLTRTTILKYINELRDEGDVGAIERIKKYRAWRENAQKERKAVLEYWQMYPYSSDKEVAEGLEIPFDDVRKHKRALLKKDPYCIKPRSMTIRDANINLLVADYFKRNPLATQAQASEDIGLSRAVISRACVELSDQIQAEAHEVYGLVSSWYAEELMRVIETCDRKLGQIKVATHGTRWVELKLQAMKMLARKFRIEQPDVNVNLNVEVGKEERDAAADAIAKSMAFSSQIKLVEPLKQIEGTTTVVSKDHIEDDEVVDV